MSTKTLLHLNYLNRIFILVNQENYADYSFHGKVGNEINRKVFKELDGNAKEQLAAYLITIERYYFQLEKKETGKTDEELLWDESYVQLTQFIDTLIPGYSFRLAYLERESLKKDGKRWVSTYIMYVVNANQLKEKKPVFRLIHEENKQVVEWIEKEVYLIEHYPHFEQTLSKIKENELLVYKQGKNPNAPQLFEGFDDLLD